MAAIFVLILVAFFVIFYFLGKNSEILKDSISDQIAFDKAIKDKNIQDAKTPFSLSRTQLAFWTSVIVSSFLYVLIVSGFKKPVMDDVNLILLGISMGTTALASSIDSTQQKDKRHQNQPSEGFFIDILSDRQGVSIHRFQNVIWTLVVGTIYIVFVFSNKALPDSNTITNQLLILMGIGSGTYLGLKIPENLSK